MQPFEQTPAFAAITNHYTSLKKLPAKVRQTQIPALQAIINSDAFIKIASTFNAIEEYFGCQLTTADPTFVSLKLMEIEANREEDCRLETKIHASIQKLQQIISTLDEQNTLIEQKYQWLENQIGRYEASLTDISEEVDIIQSQNQKLKSNPKSSSIKSGDREQLKSLLAYYRCSDRPFPRNKTEVLMLVNRIESMIQQLQMKKLSSYLLQ